MRKKSDIATRNGRKLFVRYELWTCEPSNEQSKEKRKKGATKARRCAHTGGGGGIDKIDSSFSVTSLLNLLLIGTADTSNVIPAIILTGPIIACKIIIIPVFRRSYPYLNTRIGEKWLMKQFSIVLSVSKAVRCKNICLW